VGNVIIGNPGGSGANPGGETDNSKVVFSGPTVVIGNVTVLPGSTVVISIPPIGGGTDVITEDTKPLLNVSGCFALEGELEVTIDPDTWNSNKEQLNGRQTLLVESSCSIISSSQGLTVNTPKDCRKTKGVLTQVARSNGRFGLVSSLEVNSSRCNVWWIVLVSVVGGVLVIVGIIVIVYMVHRKKVMGPVRRPRPTQPPIE
jgi:hypothetical protein